MIEKIKSTLSNLRIFFFESVRGRWIVIALALLVLSGSALRVAFLEKRQAFFVQTNRSDFDDYFQAAKLISSGKSPYRTEELQEVRKENFDLKDLLDPEKLKSLALRIKGVGTYLYPPFTASLLFPLTGLSYQYAAFFFQMLSLFSLAGFLLIFRRVLALPGEVFEKSVFAGVLITFHFLQSNASNGNIGFFIILLSGAGVLLAFHRSILLEFAGGFLMGLSGAMKITPGFLGLILLAGRKWIGILGMAAGVLFAFLFPAVLVGMDFNLELFQGWKGLILDTYSKNAVVRAWENNQSISGMMGKLFVPGSDLKQPSMGLPVTGFTVVSPEYLQQIGLIIRALNTALLAFALGVGAFVAFRGDFRRIQKESENEDSLRALFLSRPFIAVYFLGILVSLLVSGVSWYHAYSFLFLPVMHFAARYFSSEAHKPGEQRSVDSRGRLLAVERWMVYSLAFFGAFFPLLSSRIKDTLSMYSVMVPVMIAAAIALGVLAIRSPAREETSRGF